MGALNGRNAMPALASSAMAALAALNQQRHVCCLRKNWPAIKKQQAKRQADPHGDEPSKKPLACAPLIADKAGVAIGF